MFYHRDIAQYAVQGLWGHARDRLGNIVDTDDGVDTDNDDSDCCGGNNNYDDIMMMMTMTMVLMLTS